MNIKKLITSVVALAASVAVNIQAQSLPTAHSNAADVYLSLPIAAESFADKAFASARANTPFAAVAAYDALASFDRVLAGHIVDYAAKFLGSRYVWGATGPSAFDCSGFTSYVYRNFGLTLHRTSSEQFTQGERVRQVRDFQPGDLMFFSSRRSGSNGIGHVGMVVSVDRENNSCTFIHASTNRGVVYQNFPDDGYYSSHFKGARRIIGTDQMAAR